MEFEKTTRAQRRQTIAKLVLGHLLEAPIRHGGQVMITHRGEFSPAIDIESRAIFPSETLCAKVALALDPTQYESCRMADLDEHTVETVIGDRDY